MILAVSPHLDDAVFSAGGFLAGRADAVLLTAFTLTVPGPTGFALACQTDKGIVPEADYMALRRAEDERAAERLGVAGVLHLPLPEAPHRGYGSAAALFGPVREDDAAWEPLADALRGVVSRLRPDLVLGPQGLGDHVDHLHVVRALDAALDPGIETRRWRDLPYGLGEPAEPAPPLTGAARRAKLDACACYATQLGFQFGGEEAMRAVLAEAPEAFRPAPRAPRSSSATARTAAPRRR